MTKISPLLLIIGFLLSGCNFRNRPIPTPTFSPLPPEPNEYLTQLTTGFADLVFTNGTILTMDKSNPTAEGIAIQGNRILAVSRNNEILQYIGENTIEVDLEGRVVLPGFIDSHTHRITQRYKWDFSTVEEAAHEALSQGWTGLTELSVDESQLNELRKAAESETLKVKVNVYLIVNSFDGSERFHEWYNNYQPGQQFGPYLRIAGLKVFIDGDSGHVLFWEQEELNEFLRQRQDEGWQIAVKAIGKQSHELLLNAYENILLNQDNDSYRHRIEHSLAVDDDQLSRMAQLRLVASIQPSFPGVIWYEPDIHALVSEQGMEDIFRWRDYLNAGVIMVASPYNPDGFHEELISHSHISPMGLFFRSVTQTGLDGSPPEGWMLQKTLTVEEILPMLTITGAFATFEESGRGSLTPGKAADLVILSDNPLNSPPNLIKDIQVLLTLVEGNPEYCADGFKHLCTSNPIVQPQATTQRQYELPLFNLALESSVTASASLQDQPARDAIDGNMDTNWGSGGHPEQWIRLDLGKPASIRTIRLIITQYPKGETIHQIWAGEQENNLTMLHEFRGVTTDFDVLEFQPESPISPIRFIRVVTTQSPSWVSWREIEVIGE